MLILADTTTPVPIAALWVGLPLVMAIAAAAFLGLFRRGRIVGPARLDENQPLDPVVWPMFAWYAVTVIAPSQFYRLLGGHALPTSQPSTQPAVDQKIALAELFTAVVGIAVTLGVMFALRLRPRRIGLAPGQLIPGILRAFAGAFFVAPVMLLALIGADQLWSRLHYQGIYIHDSLRELGATNDRLYQATLLLTILVAVPIYEEIFFRGCMQTLAGALLSRLSKTASASPPAWARWLAIILTSIIFAWAHPWWSRPPIFVLSLCIGYAYERTGILWTAIGLHALFNGAEVLLFLLR